MGKPTWKGIYARKASIRVYFVYAGNEYFESLNIPPTPANMNYADSMRKEILRRIEIGTFKFEDYFPESKNVKKEGTEDLPVFIKIAEAWLDSKKRKLAETTVKEYRKTIYSYFLDSFGDKVMASITFFEIDTFMSGLEVSNKTFNNILSVMRGIYAYAVKASKTTGVIEDQAKKIEFVEKEEAIPDPLNKDEAVIVLQDMKKHYDERIEIYFALAMRLGFRPSEGIDLRWSNVDWNEKTLKVSTARVRGIIKCTKTGKSRTVELDDGCMALLTRLKKHTFMAGDHLFTYPVTGRPFTDTSYLVENYWHPSLKRCKIRGRGARQTRHTCASMMLAAGCKPAWAASQLGHSVEMFLRVYSKWIPENNKREELSKMSGMFEDDSSKTMTGSN